MNAEMKDSIANELADAIVCPNCSQTNEPLVHFCVKCSAPLSSLANISPWETTLSEGFAYRQAVGGPPKRIILFGMWIIFAPALMTSLVFLITIIGMAGRNGYDRELIGMCLGMFLMGAVSAVLLFRTTRNYIRKRRMGETSADDVATRAAPEK